MNPAERAYSHRRSILFLLATFSAAGLYSGLTLPVSLFPQVTFPRVVVSIDAGDRPAERMAVEVTQPVEEAVRSRPGCAEPAFDDQPRQCRNLDQLSAGAKT